MAIQQKGNQNDSTSPKSAGQSSGMGQSGTSGSQTSGTMSAGASSAKSAGSSSQQSSSSASYSAGTSGAATSGMSGTAGSAGSTQTSGSRASEGLIGQVKSSAGDAFGSVKDRAAEKIEEQKHTLASGLTNVADNIRRLGSQVSTEPQTSENIAKYAGKYSETAAAKLEQAADYFDQNDLNAIYHDVENAARNNAAIFIGGAFAIGFLAARFLKSSRSGSNGGQLNGRKGKNGWVETDVQSLGH